MTLPKFHTVTILVTITLLSLLLTTFGVSQPMVKVGVLGGINFASPEITPNPVSTTTHAALLCGAISEIRLSETGSFQTGVLYIQDRSSLDTNASRLEFDYLQIPVLLKANLLTPPLRPYFLVGPALGISLKRKLDATIGGTVQQSDLRGSINAIDCVLYAGSGAEYQVNEIVNIFGDLRYSFGIMNINKLGGDQRRNSGLQLLVGTKFSL